MRMTNSPSNKIDWVTPKRIIDALGDFDLDPCCAARMPWRTAKIMVTCHQNEKGFYGDDEAVMNIGDGLSFPWSGRVWLNPPYGKAQDEWLEKMAEHGNGIALIPVATSTKRWSRLAKQASAICFVLGRINFYDQDGKERRGNNLDSALIAYGENNVQALKSSRLGHTIIL